MTIERISADDAVSLATDVGEVPMQVGAVLVVDGPLDPAALANRLEARLASVPRLRQRLQRTPVGAGRAVWVDDEAFDLARHLEAESGDDLDLDGLWDVMIRTICRPLDRSGPLWRAAVVPHLADGRSALVVAFHHVLTDGIGGLAVLANLVDVEAETGEGEPHGNAAFPAPAPSTAALVRDAARTRAATVLHPGAALGRLRDAFVQLAPTGSGGARRTSLNRPTGPRRRLLSAAVPLDALHRGARAHGGTINDALLTAVGGALGELLAGRGEQVEELVVSVPMSARRSASGTALGNEVGAVPVRVPTGGSPAERMQRVAVATARARGTARGSSMAILGPLFRLLARVGIFGWFVDHQHLVHTFVTNLRGPEEQLSLLGSPISQVLPAAMITGNVTVSFAALSYAGEMGITIIVDPDACPDADALAGLLQRHLEAVCELGRHQP